MGAFGGIYRKDKKMGQAWAFVDITFYNIRLNQARLPLTKLQDYKTK